MNRKVISGQIKTNFRVTWVFLQIQTWTFWPNFLTEFFDQIFWPNFWPVFFRQSFWPKFLTKVFDQLFEQCFLTEFLENFFWPKLFYLVSWQTLKSLNLKTKRLLLFKVQLSEFADTSMGASIITIKHYLLHKIFWCPTIRHYNLFQVRQPV